MLHNAVKYATDLVGGINVITGVARDAEGVSRVSETLHPIIDPYKPEYGWLTREIIWSSGVNSTAVAAELSGAAVLNPAAALNQIIIVDGCTADGSAALACRLTQTVLLTDITATYALSVVAQARDQRWWQGGPLSPGYQTRVQVWLGTNAGTLGGITAERITIGGGGISTPFSSFPYVLRPGGALLVEGQTVNVPVNLNFWGRVRVALPGELPA